MEDPVLMPLYNVDELFGLRPLFFLFHAVKFHQKRKALWTSNVYLRHLWVRNTFTQKHLFGTVSGLSTELGSRDSEINKTSPSPQGTRGGRDIQQQSHSSEESVR